MSDEVANDTSVPVAGLSDQDLQALGDSVLSYALRRVAGVRGSTDSAIAGESIAAFQDSL